MALYRRQADLLEAEVATDIVALDPALGKCFGFNEVAASVWRYLAEPRSFAEIEAYLLSEFDVQPDQCASELRELLEDMEANQLIEPTD